MKKKIWSILLSLTLGASMLAGGFSSVYADDDEDMDEIVVALMTLSPIDESASEHVEERLNEILAEECDFTADFQWYDASTYMSTVPMSIAADEQLDLMMFIPAGATTYSAYMNQNQLMDITDYIDEYGEDIKETLGDYLTSTSKGGRIYGVGNMGSLSTRAQIVMRQDILDELGLTEKAEQMTTWSEFKEILEEVVEKTDLNGLANTDAEGTVMSPQPYVLGSDNFAENYDADTVGDAYQYIYADPDTDTIRCYFENPDWKENVQRANDFYKAGLIYKDAATSQDFAVSLLRSDVTFALVLGGELGGKATYEAGSGYPIFEKIVAPGVVKTASFTKFGFAVPVTSDYPEEAVQLLNLMYSNKEFLDTLTWGVEGEDWVLGDDGLATYPEGVTADTVQYHTADFLYGNRLMVTPWEGEASDIREQQIAANAEMETSKYLGFSVDPEPVAGELASVKAVVDQYKPALVSGNASDFEAAYNELIEKMYTAGLQTIIDTYQQQLDAWLAENA